MAIESQSGATRYRINPTNPCNVQMQTGSGKLWMWHSTYRDAAEAQAAVLRLGRGEAEQEVKA